MSGIGQKPSILYRSMLPSFRRVFITVEHPPLFLKLPSSVYQVHKSVQIYFFMCVIKKNESYYESIRINTKYQVPCTKTQEAEFRSKYESLLGTLYLVPCTILYQIVAFPPNNRMLTINSCVWLGSR